MNEQLIVKNFGPIDNATVDFKRVTVFIGPTGGGKSTLAKLAAVFRNSYWSSGIRNDKTKAFEELLNSFLILDFIKENGNAEWISQKGNASYSKNGLEHDNRKQSELAIARHDIYNYIQQRLGGLKIAFDSIPAFQAQLAISSLVDDSVIVEYIPADRSFAASVDNSIAGLTIKDIALPEALLFFLNDFQIAKNNLAHNPLKIPFLNNITYEIIDEQARISLGINNTFTLGSSASGVQAVVPMMLVINDASRLRSKVKPHSFIIEEPELNLYPAAQQGLLNWLIEKCTQNENENDLTITTHSPYILSSCNLLLEAYKVAQLRPDLEDEIAAIVPKACWLNPDEFAAYYVADGTVKPITDDRTHLIGGNELDAVSGDISDSFRKLLRLKKQVA
ncbi:AAA family ATPase [Hymenobacter coccineus]|uniref:AAA family ATPase n=1 Tax=Hymenobacter coccineus TaxID=1908235 RepID=UPI0009F28E4D|nr:AAA family ATPase [Hymenobacter coccineus]